MKSPGLNIYQALDSPIHHLDPRVKVVLTILIIVSNVLLPDGAWMALGASWALILFTTQLSRVSLKFLLTRSAVVLPFALAAVPTAFSTPGEEVFHAP